MRHVLVSACLLGKNVRYDGGSLATSDDVLERWRAQGIVMPVCPEVEAGMSIPRNPAEIIGGDGRQVLDGQADVVENSGHIVTSEFVAGASIALALCRKHSIRVAVLAESSPSCGSATVFDGRFAGKKVVGEGVTAALLRRNGVAVFSQYQLAEADRWLSSLDQSG